MSRIPIRLPGKQAKYRAERTDGYASKKEATRAAELELLARQGLIIGLVKQPAYVLVPADELGPAVTYRADFSYWDREAGKLLCVEAGNQNCKSGTALHFHVEDVKGFKTPVYKLKRRLMWQIFKIRIEEV